MTAGYRRGGRPPERGTPVAGCRRRMSGELSVSGRPGAVECVATRPFPAQWVQGAAGVGVVGDASGAGEAAASASSASVLWCFASSSTRAARRAGSRAGERPNASLSALLGSLGVVKGNVTWREAGSARLRRVPGNPQHQTEGLKQKEKGSGRILGTKTISSDIKATSGALTSRNLDNVTKGENSCQAPYRILLHTQHSLRRGSGKGHRYLTG